MSTLYIEPFSGLSGDMFLGALAELCDAHEDLADLPVRLGLEDGKVEIVTVNKNGIECRHVKVIDLGHDDTHTPDHDRGHKHESVADHEHHHHDHTHPQGHSHSHGAHRHLSDILEIIDRADLPAGAKANAREIFRLIGEAESKVHAIPIEKIHFHEISAVDSIIDIVGCAWLIDRLQMGEVYSDAICTGFGMVDIQHGRLPVPAPATALLLQGMPCYKGDEEGERVTPTGAAILRFLKPKFTVPALSIDRIAYGPGLKDFSAANVLRLSLASSSSTAETIEVIETNVDDLSAEMLGEAFQTGLLKAGAVDFTLTSAIMKKGRPGIVISALAPPAKADAVTDYLLEHTSTLGIRRHSAKRSILERQSVELETEFGKVAAKRSALPSGRERLKIEYDALARIAAEQELPIAEVKRRIDAEAALQ